ncbi:hypothetical protein [Ruminococcus sp.]|uniref:hypothetical protein n=1 Tax=Ruminococcus sp. TaxID=41978 RepID=UPI0025D2385F|nr:hypothetical protein [Ruminococcus sp.]MCR4639073.1 hypothetical protein [Ruminococcus sp.]
MKNVLKKVSAIALAFTLLGSGTAVAKNVNPKLINTITANADYSTNSTYYVPSGTNLYIRTGPGTSYGHVQIKYKNRYYNTFVMQNRTFNVIHVQGNWGYSTNLVNDWGRKTSGWVSLGYCRYY